LLSHFIFIPGITLTLSETNMPFQQKRKISNRLSYAAVTVNKHKEKYSTKYADRLYLNLKITVFWDVAPCILAEIY
jgi:hypothetical protein